MKEANTADNLRALLEKVPTIELDASFDYELLLGGLTNENYHVSLGDKQFVLRINNPGSELMGLNREREFIIHHSLVSDRLAPAIIYNDPEHQFRLTEWLDGTVWTKKSFRNKASLNRLVRMVKKIHKKDPKNLPKISLAKKVNTYRERIIAAYEHLPSLESELGQAAINLLAELEPKDTQCLCHNDLVAANIISTREATYIIDYEYAGVSSPMFELAVIARANQLDAEHIEYLLSCYYGDDWQNHSESFDSWCWFYDYLSLIWAIAIGGNPSRTVFQQEDELIKLHGSMPD